jgi:DNA repair protein RadC
MKTDEINGSGNEPIVIFPNYPKINNADKAYKVLIENWDVSRLNRVKDVKTLALDGAKNVICEISFHGGPSTLYDNVQQSLRIAKANKAVKVIVGLNQLNKALYPGDRDKTLAKKIKAYSEELQLDVDQMVVSENAYFSFVDDQLK